MGFAGSAFLGSVGGDAWFRGLALVAPSGRAASVRVQPLPAQGSRGRARPASALGAPADAAIVPVSADAALACLVPSRASEPRAAPATLETESAV